MQNQDKQELNIQISEEVADGIYSNLAIISHSPDEVVLDFVRLVPNIDHARVKSRVLMSPHHAKRLLAALSDNLQRYEQEFGPIKDPRNGSRNSSLSYSGPKGQA